MAGSPRRHVVRVKRALLAACMTCPLCRNLLDEATTISECLHTFCRKCIFEKLTDEEADCCPICNIELGCVPVEKLRPDHSLQDVRAKIFPFKRRKVNAPEMPSISLPVRRKERSLSSLVVNTPPVVTQTGLTGKRTKAAARRAATLHGSSHAVNGSSKKDNANAEYCAENTKPPKILNTITRNRRQNSSNAETSSNNTENGESCMDKAKLWKPLHCLAEAAKLKSAPESPVVKAEQINVHDSDLHIPKTKVREHPKNSRVQDDKNGNGLTSSGPVKAKKVHGISRKRKELETSAQALLDAAAGGKHEMRISPIWFSLVAAADQDGDAPMPQLSASFLRIKDGDLPASFIQKYLMKKLDLASETDVDITCRGQPVEPTMPLHGLVDMWLQVGSSRTAHAVGSSAKDFVMVLTYCRKASIPSLRCPG